MRSLLVLSMSAATFALAQSTLIPALTTLQEEFDTDAAGVAWVLTGYLVTAAVFTPIMGRLGDMFGKRRLLVISLLAFAAGAVKETVAVVSEAEAERADGASGVTWISATLFEE